jgi:hypothetical protein
MSKEQVARDRTLCSIVLLGWAALMICGCAYVVFWKGASGWWFVLAAMLSSGKCRVRDDDTDEIVKDEP